MTTANAALLEALGDCLESGDTLVQALGKIDVAGVAARSWTEGVRRSTRAEAPVATTLRDSNTLNHDELSLLPAEGVDAAVAAPLHAVVVRRRRSVDRRRAVLWGLVGPFGFGALTVVLDPLPNRITGGAFVWPMIRGLLALGILALAIVAGVPALLRAPRARSRILRTCIAVPGIRWFAALYAEEEVTTALAPFLDDEEVSAAGLTAAASLLAWSRLSETLRRAAGSVRPPSTPIPMGGLEPLARQLSLATNLAIVGGVASKRLAERLTERGAAIAVLLTARLRLAVRVVAYALVVAFSVSSLAGMVSRGLPGMPTLPGGVTSPDQQELDEFLKQMLR
jgi:hypothetical protein